MNRGVSQAEIFADSRDYSIFLSILATHLKKNPNIKLCSYCLMPNHWHLALWPMEDGCLSSFIQNVSSRHVENWRKRWDSTGHLYESRFKCFAVQDEKYYLNIVRYIERNPVRASLVKKAVDWQWSSYYLRSKGYNPWDIPLSSGPVPIPANWDTRITRPENDSTLSEIRQSHRRSSPYGEQDWVEETAKKLGVLGSIKPLGRPLKTGNGV
jgi:putative transposase